MRLKLLDSKGYFSSTFELFAVIKSDLVKVGRTQNILKKYVISSTNNIDVKIFLFLIKTAIIHHYLFFI